MKSTTIFTKFFTITLVMLLIISPFTSYAQVLEKEATSQEAGVAVTDTEIEQDEEETLDLGNNQAEQDSKKDFTGIVRQTKDYYCGPASLATLITQLGDDITEEEVLQNIQEKDLNSEQGTNLLALKIASEKLGQTTWLKKWSSDEILSYIQETSDPVLIHDEKKGVGGHFSVIRDYDKEKGIVELSDTEAGNIKYSVEDFNHIYTGHALVVASENPTGVDMSDEEAATIWGKYVPVYMAAIAVDGSDVNTQNAVNTFKVCIANVMKITTLSTRNNERSLCYTKLSNSLRTSTGMMDDLLLAVKVESSKTDKNIENEQSVGTVDILQSLRSVLANQTSYNTENPIYLALIVQGGGSLSNLATYSSQLASINSKIDTYNADISVLNSTLSVKQSSYNDTNSKISSGSFVQNGITYSLGTVGNQVTAQSTTYAKLSAALSSKLSTIDSQISNLNRQIAAAQSSVTSYTNQANSYTAQANTAYNNYNYYKAKKGYTSTAQNYYNQYQTYISQASSASSNAQYYKNQVTAYQSQISSLQNQKASAQSEVSTASSELAKAQRLKAFGDAEIQRLKTLLATMNSDIVNLKSQITAKTTALINYKTSNQTTIATLIDKIAKLTAAQSYLSRITAYQSKIDTVKSRYGFTTLTYSNTSETQKLINDELSFQKNQENTTELTTINDSSNPVTNFGSATIGSLMGIASSVVGIIEAVGTIIIKPLQTVTNLAQALINYDTTANVIYEGLRGRALAIVQVDNSSFVSFYNSSKATSQTLTDVCLVVCTFGGGAVIKGVEISKTAVVVSDIANASEKVNALAKITTALRGTQFARLLSEALASLGKATTAEELITKASQSTLRVSEASSSTVHVLYGTVESARAVFDVVTKGWMIEKETAELIVKISPDGLSKIGFRLKSSTPAMSPLKTINATMDVQRFEKYGTIFKELGPKVEIKFAQ